MATVLPIVGVIMVVAAFIYYKIRTGANAEDELDEADRKRKAQDDALAAAQKREADARAAEARQILAIGDPEERRRRAIGFLLKSGRKPPPV